MLNVHLAPKAVVQHALLVVVAPLLDGFRQFDGEICIILPGPSASDTITRQRGLVLHTQIGPQRLSLVIIDAAAKVQYKLTLCLGESILMNAHTLRGGKLSQNIVVVQLHLVIARRALFCVVRETRAVAAVRVLSCSRVGADTSCCGHNQDIAQIRVARATQMSMTEAYNSLIVMLITGTILVNFTLIVSVHVVRDGIRLRA